MRIERIIRKALGIYRRSQSHRTRASRRPVAARRGGLSGIARFLRGKF